jgi:hypothetical protein
MVDDDGDSEVHGNSGGVDGARLDKGKTGVRLTSLLASSSEAARGSAGAGGF